MTDNTEFLARYLKSDEEDYPPRDDPAAVGDEAAIGQEPHVSETGQFQSIGRQSREAPPPVGGRASGGTRVGQGSRGDRSHPGVEAPSVANRGPQRVGDATPIQQPACPPAQPQNPTTGQPTSSFESNAGEGASLPSPYEWLPRVDPTTRWTPHAASHGTTGPLAGQHIQLSEVVKRRREPAEMGWRKVVYLSTGHLVNLGAGPSERRLLHWKERIATNIPGNYQIAAISVKGGVGKSRITAGVGSIFAELRKQPVLAIDANPTYGGLSRLIDPRVRASVRDFLAAKDVLDYPRARYYTGQNKQGLEVLAGNQNVASPLALNAGIFTDTVSRARRFYQLALVDCGAEIEHAVIPAVLSASDALLIVGSCTVEGVLAIETTIDWLAARNGHALLKRSVVVLNDSHRSSNKGIVDHVNQTLGKRVMSVKMIPWDPHLQEAVTLDFPALRRRTRLAFMELAAELAGGFPTAGSLAA